MSGYNLRHIATYVRVSKAGFFGDNSDFEGSIEALVCGDEKGDQCKLVSTYLVFETFGFFEGDLGGFESTSRFLKKC